jgi:phospholipase C
LPLSLRAAAARAGSTLTKEYEHVNQQLFGSADKPTEANPPYGTPAATAWFAYDYYASYESWDQLDQIAEAYSPAQLPILNGLAKTYVVSRRVVFFSAHADEPRNRAFALCGTSLGRVDNTWNAVEQFQTPTIWNGLSIATAGPDSTDLTLGVGEDGLP